MLLPFPFTDQTQGQEGGRRWSFRARRISGNGPTSSSWRSPPVRPAQTVGEVAVRDWQGAGLLKPSVIKPVVTTIEKNLVLKTLGRLQEADQQALRQVISSIIG